MRCNQSFNIVLKMIGMKSIYGALTAILFQVWVKNSSKKFAITLIRKKNCRGSCPVVSIISCSENYTNKGCHFCSQLKKILLVVSTVPFAPYLTGLSSIMLIWAAEARCMWRAHLYNRMPWQRLKPQTFESLSKQSTTELSCHLFLIIPNT